MKKINFVFIMLIAIFIVILSIGYAFFSDSLSINGVATTVDFYSGDALPTEPIKFDPWNDRYHTRSEGVANVNFESESWNGDTFTLIYDKKAGVTCAQIHNVRYTISFSNPTELEYTNGTISAETVQNGMNYIGTPRASMNKTSLKPGEAIEIYIDLTFSFCAALGTQEVKATVSFDLQGKTRYFYFVLRYT